MGHPLTLVGFVDSLHTTPYSRMRRAPGFSPYELVPHL